MYFGNRLTGGSCDIETSPLGIPSGRKVKGWATGNEVAGRLVLQLVLSEELQLRNLSHS